MSVFNGTPLPDFMYVVYVVTVATIVFFAVSCGLTMLAYAVGIAAAAVYVATVDIAWAWKCRVNDRKRKALNDAWRGVDRYSPIKTHAVGCMCPACSKQPYPPSGLLAKAVEEAAVKVRESTRRAVKDAFSRMGRP